MKMYAQIDSQGTACAETALCEAHTEHSEAFYAARGDTDGSLVECSANEALSCQYCGRVS